MQTNSLFDSRASWPQWADYLHRHGLEHLAAWVLEAAGPLTALGAQLLYIGGPLLRPAISDHQIDSLAKLLENDGEVRAFSTYLREGKPL